MQDWLYFETGSTWAPYNLAMEEALVDNLSLLEGRPCFLLWQNSPSVIIGRHQNARTEVNLEELKKRDINLVRRMTGGGAVYHDLGNINYSFVMPQAQQQTISNADILAPMIDALKQLGINAEMKGRNDLTIEGAGKFSGLASRQPVAKFQLHGTMMYDVDVSMLEKVLLVDPEKYKSKGIASVKARVTNLKPLITGSLDELWQTIKGAYTPEAAIIPDQIIQQAEHLAQTKYSQDEWNIGQSPAGDILLKKRFAFGSLELHLQTNKNIITQAKITGDFITPSNTLEQIPVEALEEALVGLPSHDNSLLRQAWSSFDFSRIFYGNVNKEEILTMLFGQS